MTRTFDMEIGGRQGSSLTGRLFSKLMDTLSEELNETGMGFNLSMDLVIAVLLWVDDVLTFAVGEEEQQIILKKIDEFATRHKIKWGQAKCKVMRVGRHEQKDIEWKLGDLTIDECTSYKYLGDYVTCDGKNAENIESRKTKMKITTMNINSIAASDVMCLMEAYVLLELHEKINIPSLLTNAESWNLNKGEMDNLERIELQAIKQLFNLPVHTPTPAIIFTFGLLYTRFRIHQKQLLYLHKILKRYSHWTKQTLMVLQ